MLVAGVTHALWGETLTSFPSKRFVLGQNKDLPEL